jgi:hypothetical protein
MLRTWAGLTSIFSTLKCSNQGCGSISGLDPDSVTFAGSRGKKIKKFQWKKCTFLLFFKNILPLKRYKIALHYFLRNFLMNNTGIFDLI